MLFFYIHSFHLWTCQIVLGNPVESSITTLVYVPSQPNAWLSSWSSHCHPMDVFENSYLAYAEVCMSTVLSKTQAIVLFYRKQDVLPLGHQNTGLFTTSRMKASLLWNNASIILEL